MISPSKALANATESAVLPLAVGPPTATTRGLDKSAKLLFQLLPGDFQYAGPPVRAERRDCAVHDALGQREHLGGVRAVPRFDGRAAGDGMQHPLGLSHAERRVRRRRALPPAPRSYPLHRPPARPRARRARQQSQPPKSSASMPASVRRSRFCKTACFSAAVRLTCTGDKQHLGRHAAVVPGQLLKQNALMRSVLVDKAKLTCRAR